MKQLKDGKYFKVFLLITVCISAIFITFEGLRRPVPGKDKNITGA
jgi:hypothetical protein